MYIENKWTIRGDVFVMADGTQATRDEMQGYLDNIVNARDTNSAAYTNSQETYDKYISDWTALLGDG